MQTGCARRLLAAGEFALVELCSCGSVHVTIGAVTLRLMPQALPVLASVIGDAARTLVLGTALHSAEPVHEVLS